MAKVSAADISKALNITERAVQIRARREKWLALSKSVRGGKQKLYFSNMLPKDVQTALADYKVQENSLVPVEKIKPQFPDSRPDALVNIPKNVEKPGLAKYCLVKHFREKVNAAKWGKKQETEQAFVLAYNTGRLLPQIFAELGEINLKTLRSLDLKLRNNKDDFYSLCDGRGGWKQHGTTKWRDRQLSEEAKKAFLQCYLNPKRPTIKLAVRAARHMLQKYNIADQSSYSTYRRWLKDYEKTNAHIICLAREGMKAYVDKYGDYMTRDVERLKVGDCLVADGKTLNFYILHPFTGKPCRMTLIIFFDWASRYPAGWQIMPTENTRAIRAAFRNAVITLGRYPVSVYTDNGKAFKAKYFTDTNPDLEQMTGLYERVGTHLYLASPYNGRAKVVERFNLTIQQQCESLIPSYCGDSIVTKPAYLHRNEKFHKAWFEAKTKGWVPNIREAAFMIDKYFQWYAHQHQDKLGSTPQQIFDAGKGPGIDPFQLNYDFLWRAEIAPRRCRIRLQGTDYEADFLHGLCAKEKLLVMYDNADLSEIYVYSRDNIYMGTAYPVESVHPLASLLGTEEDVERVMYKNKHHRQLIKKTTQGLIELGATKTEAINALPYQPETITISPSENKEIEMSESDRKRLEQLYDEFVPEDEEHEEGLDERVYRVMEENSDDSEKTQVERPFWITKIEKYDWLFRAKYDDGIELSEKETAFMQEFESTEKYEQEYKDTYESLKEYLSIKNAI